ncbi:hypothetical protein GCM10028803_15570 [Larkinella knui]|uniref:Uncharacterized protein n=1 Tax=Larkinella knui TaxID=2025310 RepID=A0A3P1C9I6_9BACT|nr:hypothetical protein [Larkinella knui]RRB09927.1 hypothetical protein EHT87_30885 [Larkinella knui]
MLTPHHLTILRHDLRTLAHIEYEEVENELLDHYATLTEQKMEAGQDFEHASAYAWAELGAGPGLNTIQRDYEKNIRKQVSSRHLEILKSYFRWPTVVMTLLIGGLVHKMTPSIPVRFILAGMHITILIPFVIMGISYLKSQDLGNDSRKITWTHLNARAAFFVNIFQASLSLQFQGDGSAKVLFFQNHAAILSIVESIVIIYLLSFLQLYRENFSYKTAR